MHYNKLIVTVIPLIVDQVQSYSTVICLFNKLASRMNN